MERSQLQAEEELKGEWEKKQIYKGKIISLRADTLKSLGRPSHTWDIVEHPGAVVIVPITDEGDILLVKQWRRAAEKILLELPAGTLENGEPPLLCAQRELQEETGYRAHELIPMGGFFSAPGFCTEYLHLFLAKGLYPSPLPHDDNEAIDLVKMPLAQALEMIDAYQFLDAKTIAGILLYARRFKK
jgi:ADP-ribose diphosphatase